MIVNKNYVIRLSSYRNALKRFKEIGFIKVFSDNISDAVGVTSVQIRKDFSIFGITGNKKGGYHIDDLLAKINSILGKDRIQEVIIVGSGKIGTALINYNGFEQEGIKIVAGFDNDQSKWDEKAPVPIMPIDKAAEFIKKKKISIGIIAVTAVSAQQVMDIMSDAGIKGVLNFAPVRLRAREDIVINNIDVKTELENVIYFRTAFSKSKNHEK